MRATPRTERALRVWDFKYGEAAMGDVMREIDRAFEAKHPGVRVDHSALSDVDDDMVLAAALAANAGPDVVMVHSGAELRVFESHFLPLDEAFAPYADRILPGALEACRGSDGRVMAVPLTVQGFGWYYNKRLFAAAGLDAELPPHRWEDFLAACGTLGAAGILPIAWGNNPPHGSDWLRRSFASTFYSDEELKGLFASPAFADDDRFIRITLLIRELRDRGYLDSAGAFRDHIRDASALFRSGKAAMYFGLLSDIANWKEFSDALGPADLGFFASVDHPSAARPGRLCLQGAGIVYSVLASSPDKDLATEYALSYLENGAAELFVRRVGALVPLKDARYPLIEYPVLAAILGAMKTSADDPELHYPDLSVKEALFRYDELFYDTREIGIESYRDALRAAAEGFARP